MVVPSEHLPVGDVMAQLLALLSRYIPAPTAHSVLHMALQRAGLTGERLCRAHLYELVEPVDWSLRLFLVDGKRAVECRGALAALAGGQDGTAPVERVTLEVRSEADIVVTRQRARDLAAASGFSVVGRTRLMTAVSELARNIVQYAGAGQIQITPTQAPPSLEIVASDRGPGIPNLEQILAGNYRSRLGMGLGLRGVKKVADRFEVQSSPGVGTTVSFVMRVC